MMISIVSVCLVLFSSITSASAAAQPGVIESFLLSIEKRPWLLSVYVFTVGLPIILFISFMWPDKRFGPPDQPYYYKKSDDAQPDDPESFSPRQSANIKESLIRATTSEEAPLMHERKRSKIDTNNSKEKLAKNENVH